MADKVLTIFESLAVLPSGAIEPALTQAEVSDYFTSEVLTEADANRKELARFRERVYTTRAHADMAEDINRVFGDKEVIKKRLEWAERAQSNNVCKHVINEGATLYIPPTLREVNGETNQAHYLKLQQLSQLQIAFREASRKLSLHNDLLMMFRIRNEGYRLIPVVDLVHPGRFSVIKHPRDRTLAIGVVVEWVTGSSPADPHYRAWTHRETFMLDQDRRIIWDTYEELEFPRMPGMLLHGVPPTVRGELLDPTSGLELINAHMDVWFQQVLMLKESKSINNQVAFAGDLSGTPTGQSQDSEQDLVLGEGVTPTTINRGVDLKQYRDTADHIEERAAGNRGVPPSVLRHQGASSGHEIELRMLPLMIQREMQIEVFRPIEREFAAVMSMVTTADMPELAFSLDGWKVNYGEIRIPRSAQERINVFLAERGAGLTDTLEELKRRDPDLDDAGALLRMIAHIENETIRNAAMRPMMAINGSMGNEAPMVEGKPNGAAGSGGSEARMLAQEVLGVA